MEDPRASPDRLDPGIMIMGGLSGGAARSLPDLGVLADGRKGAAFGEASVENLAMAFDADRRSMISGMPGRRPRSSPNVTVLPLSAAQRHDKIVDPIHGPRPRRTVKRPPAASSRRRKRKPDSR